VGDESSFGSATGGLEAVNKAKLELLSQKLEQQKAVKYDCPGPTREVSEEVKNALEVALNETPTMTVVRCIELNCMACEVYDAQIARVDEVEEQIDALYEEDEEEQQATP
jgi:hypothetical protein